MQTSRRAADPRFRITLWPALPLPAVDTSRRSVRLGASGSLDWRPPDVIGALPDEWALRALHGVDLGSDQEVLNLLGAGMNSRPFFDRGMIPRNCWSSLAAAGDGVGRERWWADRSDGTVEDARWWLRTIRAMVGVWLISARIDDPATPEDVVEAWTNEGFLVGDADVAWQQFTVSLNEGLRPFQARAEHVRVFEGKELAWGRPRTGLYSSVCRQIFNFVARAEVPKWCANETCGRPFINQEDRAKYGQHRSTGVLYCSESHARSQAQREYRRRNKQKNLERNGK